MSTALQTHRNPDAYLQELISEAAESVKAKCVLCLGHNKGWEEAASDFAASCSPTLAQLVSSWCLMPFGHAANYLAAAVLVAKYLLWLLSLCRTAARGLLSFLIHAQPLRYILRIIWTGKSSMIRLTDFAVGQAGLCYACAVPELFLQPLMRC